MKFIKDAILNRPILSQNYYASASGGRTIYKEDYTTTNAWAEIIDGVSVIYYNNMIAIGRPGQWANNVICTVDDAFRNELGFAAIEDLIKKRVSDMKQEKIDDIKNRINNALKDIASIFMEINATVNDNIKLLPADVHILIRSEIANIVGESVANIINPKSKLKKLKDLIINIF